MKIKKFECLIDDGERVYKEYIPATSEEELKRRWAGNGEFIQISEVPDFMFSAVEVRKALLAGGCTEAEGDMIYRIMQYVEGTAD